MASLSLPPPRNSTGAAIGMSSATGVGSSSTELVVTSVDVNNDDSEEETTDQPTTRAATSNSINKSKIKTMAPTYDQRCKAAEELSRLPPLERKKKKLFVPRSLKEFDDGGAFPEIHVAQYPRHMGNPHLKKKKGQSRAASKSSGGGPGASIGASASRAIVNVEVDKNGEISYDAIVKGGTNSDKTVYSRYEDLRGGEAKPEDVALPSAREEAETANRTQLALQKLLVAKTALNKPSGSAIANANTSRDIEKNTQFIKYTPRKDAPGYNPVAAKRVIQMVPAQVDPMMPPKHMHKKAPRGPAEDPVPVLHAPPQKLTKEERDQWNVPACISNWKNTRGYTIPLDKRLAADGRGLREHTINSNFATLSEGLYVAERQARQEVRLRAQVQKKLTIQEKDRREDELRRLANQARLDRSAVMGGADTAATSSNSREPVLGDTNNNNNNNGDRRSSRQSTIPNTEDSDEDNDSQSQRQSNRKSNEIDNNDDDAVAARQRERLRKERRRERERELRQENNVELKKRKLENERDVSEKIALGVHTGSGGAGEVDERLYNQSAGMDSGFGAEDEYNTYSKPMFDRGGVTSASIYRPTRGETEHNADESYDKLVQGATSKFQPSKGFAGAEGGADIQAGPRTAPVQFEKSQK